MTNQQEWRNIFNELEILNAPINQYQEGDIFKYPINDFISDNQLIQLAESLNLNLNDIIIKNGNKKYFQDNFLSNCKVTPQSFKNISKKRYDSWYKSGSFNNLGTILQQINNNVTSRFKEKVTFKIPINQAIHSKLKIEKSIASLRKQIDFNDLEKGKSYKKFKREFSNIKSNNVKSNNNNDSSKAKTPLLIQIINFIIGIIFFIPVLIIVFLIVPLIPKKYIIGNDKLVLNIVRLIKFDEGKIINIMEDKFSKNKEGNDNQNIIATRYGFDMYSTFEDKGDIKLLLEKAHLQNTKKRS